MTRLIVVDGRVICPLCDSDMLVTKPAFMVAVQAAHVAGKCKWSGQEFRVNSQTGDAERINANANS